MLENQNGKEITKDSSPEEIVDYFVKTTSHKEEDFACLIEEKISGDVLPYLNKQDYKELNIKLEPKKRIEKFILDNINKLKRNEINIIIDANSPENEVKIFFEKYLNFKGNIKALDGKKLFCMSDQELKNLGLKIGQRRKINMYIEFYQKNKKQNSGALITEEDVFNIPEKVIKDIALIGETLGLLTEDNIDEIDDLSPETKKELKIFITKNKNQNTIENKTLKETKEEITSEIEKESYINEETHSDKTKISKQNESDNEKAENNIEVKTDISKENIENKSNVIFNYTLNNYKLEPIINDSIYNIFFFLIIKDTFLEKIKLSILATGTQVYYKCYFLYDYIKKTVLGDLIFI